MRSGVLSALGDLSALNALSALSAPNALSTLRALVHVNVQLLYLSIYLSFSLLISLSNLKNSKNK